MNRTLLIVKCNYNHTTDDHRRQLALPAGKKESDRS